MATHSSILAWRSHMDRGAWPAAVHGVKKSQTPLSTHYWWNGRLRAFERKNPDTDPHIFGQLNFDKDDTTEKQVKESVF